MEIDEAACSLDVVLCCLSMSSTESTQSYMGVQANCDLFCGTRGRLVLIELRFIKFSYHIRFVLEPSSAEFVSLRQRRQPESIIEDQTYDRQDRSSQVGRLVSSAAIVRSSNLHFVTASVVGVGSR